MFYVHHPENETELFHTEAEARAAFDALVERLGDQSSDGWHEDAESACWGELVPRQRLALRITARAEDDTPEGAKCRAEGWDYMAEGEVVDVAPPAPTAEAGPSLIARYVLGVRALVEAPAPDPTADPKE